MKTFTFMWFIENCSYCWHKQGEVLESPTFFTEMLQQSSWKLQLYPRGKNYPDFTALYLKRCDGPETVYLNCTMSFLDAKGIVLDFCKLGEVEFGLPSGMSFGYSNFLDRPAYPTDKAFTLDMLRVRCTMLMDDGEMDKEALCYAKTRIGLKRVSFVNTIENFDALEPNWKIPFDVTSISKDGIKLSGNVYVKNEPDSEDELMLEVSLDSQNVHLIKFQMCILNAAGKEVECGKRDIRNEMLWESTLSTPIKVGKENLMDKKDEYLHNDKITLRCECTLSTGIEFEGIEETFHDLHLTPLLKERINNKYFAAFTAEPQTVSDDLRSLLQDHILSDIELKTESKTFPAHKSVLCARSPVFKSMLSLDMKEKLMDCIQVEDLDDSTVEQFLLFLYSDVVEDFQWESILKLYYAADKYLVQQLKDMCTYFLITRLDKYNMSDVLILADRHQDFDLKKVVENFICRRDEKVFWSNEWKSFMKTNPELAMKTMRLQENLSMGSLLVQSSESSESSESEAGN